MPAYGRKPSPPDARDYKLVHYLGADPLDTALTAFLGVRKIPKEAKTLATIVVQRINALQPSPPLPPQPPVTSDVLWADNEAVLDQGDTPHCVGFAGADWGNTLPIDDHFVNADGDKIYYECKQVDGEPSVENGTYVRSLAKALQARGRLSAYAFAATFDEVRAWVDQHGPVVFGTDWYDQMETPDPNAYVSPRGSIVGGHAYVCIGDLASEGALLFLNSWGDGWGQHGLFKMKYQDAATLLSANGEACAAVELP